MLAIVSNCLRAHAGTDLVLLCGQFLALVTGRFTKPKISTFLRCAATYHIPSELRNAPK